MQNFHVAIIGAGLGGLCLAQALKRAGVAFDVYERDPTPAGRHQGYRIRIDAAGQHALSEALPPTHYRLFRETASMAASTASCLTPQLEPFPGSVPASWQAGGDGKEIGTDLAVNRQTLREILMAGIEERIHFNYAFDACAVADDGRVAVGFRHRRTPLLSSVLVGADGVNSRVRAQLAPEAEPDDTGSLCIYGRTALQEHEPGVASTGTRVIFADGCAAILDEMRFRAPLPLLAARIAPECLLTPIGDYLYWALIGPRERFDPTTIGSAGYGHAGYPCTPAIRHHRLASRAAPGRMRHRSRHHRHAARACRSSRGALAGGAGDPAGRRAPRDESGRRAGREHCAQGCRRTGRSTRRSRGRPRHHDSRAGPVRGAHAAMGRGRDRRFPTGREPAVRSRAGHVVALIFPLDLSAIPAQGHSHDRHQHDRHWRRLRTP